MMRYDEAAGELVFSSGRREANNGVGQTIGIDLDDLGLSWGHDGGFNLYGPDYEDMPMTPAERRELADYMIALWERFAVEGSAP